MYKTEILKNIIPEESLSQIYEAILGYISPETLSLKAFHGNYYALDDTLTTAISAFLPLLPNEIPSSLFLALRTSTGLHSDTNLLAGDNADITKYGRTFVIPFETINTHTITFDQILPRGTEGKLAIPYIKSLPIINAISQEEIDMYFKSLAHEYWINKLSVETVFPWVAGDVLLLDRHRIHTGDDHPSEVDKKCILVWTKINEN